jgi:ABC-type dipeptide/oligopeptide/nickel transport system ATPase subunit
VSLLEGRDISKRYKRNGLQVEALRDVSFTLSDGEILGVVGESGSGKSTLLRLLSGLEKADRGEFLLDGKPLGAKRTKEQYRAIQMIFQDAAGSFQPRRRISASIRDAVRSLCGRAAEPDMAGLCALVGLDPALAERYPGELSGGQCQRFAIARAAAAGPRVLLCDEITSALDVSTQAQVLRLLADVCREKHMAAMFVSHDLAVVSCVCSRVMVLYRGQLVEEGPVHRVIDAPEKEYTQQLLHSVLEVK